MLVGVLLRKSKETGVIVSAFQKEESVYAIISARHFNCATPYVQMLFEETRID